MTFLFIQNEFNLFSCINALPSVMFPDDVQPSHISAYDYPLCVDVQEPVYISMTEFRQPLQVQSHLEMPRILIQLGHIQPT